MVVEDRTEIGIGDELDSRLGDGVLTRILRLRQVVQPFDFPGTPTIAKFSMTLSEI